MSIKGRWKIQWQIFVLLEQIQGEGLVDRNVLQPISRDEQNLWYGMVYTLLQKRYGVYET